MSYSWSGGLGTAATASITAPGTYTVTVTAANGCTDTEVITITQNITLPTASISYAASPYCATGTASVTQTGQAGGTYSSTAGLVINSSTGAINLGLSTAGVYTVTYTFTGSNGCVNSTTTSITINSIPVVTITGNTMVCEGGSTTLTASGASSYVWSPSSILNTTTGSTVIVTPLSFETVTVVGTTNGCSSSYTEFITVEPLPTAAITNNTATTVVNNQEFPERQALSQVVLPKSDF